MGAQQIGFAPMPAVALILSRLDRAQLGSFVEIAIELMDVADGNPDLELDDEPEVDDEQEIDDEPEEDDHSGGSADDEGEPENGLVHPAYGIDQTTGPLSLHSH